MSRFFFQKSFLPLRLRRQWRSSWCCCHCCQSNTDAAAYDDAPFYTPSGEWYARALTQKLRTDCVAPLLLQRATGGGKRGGGSIPPFPLLNFQRPQKFRFLFVPLFYKKNTKAVSYAINSVLFCVLFFLVLAERHASYISSSPQPPPLAASSWKEEGKKKVPTVPATKIQFPFLFPFPACVAKNCCSPPQTNITISLFFFSYLANHEFSLFSSTFSSSFSFLPIPLTFCKKSRHRPIVISFPSSPSLNLQAALHLHFRHSSG